MKKKKGRNNVKYSKLLIIASLFLFVIMILRLLQLSLSKTIDDTNLQELASKRTTRTTTLSAKRGTIYSSNKDVLAQNVTSYKLIAYLSPKRTTNKNKPQHVVDKDLTAEKLAPILGMTKEEILTYLNKENKYQTEFGSKGKGLTELEKNQIQNLNLPGLDFVESYKRYYPKGNFLSYTLGYATTEEDKDGEQVIKGKMGLELYYDNILKGEDGYVTYQKDLKGYKISGTKEIKKDAVQGKDIYLTIDSNVQFFVEQALTNAKNNYGYEWFTMVIMDAKTDGTVIGDWNRNGWGYITYDRGYALSSNVGVINLLKNFMNSAMLRQYYRKLGFGKKTGITLPNESTGQISFKYETEVFNAGFGQGITTTPLQNVQAMTPLTNDGMLLKPYVVEKIVDPDTKEVVYKGKRTEKERVASTQTVQKMIQLMDDTVNGIGNTGSGFRIPSGELIGKTGTAQIAATNGRGYLNGKEDIISSFSGIYPKSNPQFIIYASVKRPAGGSQKGVSTAVKEVVSNLSKYYGTEVTETEGEKITTYKLPSLENKKLDEARQLLTANNITNQIIIGNGDKVINQYPEKNISITNKDKIFLVTNDSNITIPDVNGYSSKDATSLLNLLGIKTKLTGTGYVTAQSIAAGTAITQGMEIELTLNPKFDAGQ